VARSGPTYVAVIGGSRASDAELTQAEEVGRFLAREGAVLVCGGLGGVMDAAARGHESAGGTSVGILPGDERGSASSHLTVAISTGLGEARNAIVARTADAVVAIGGEFGTLSEIAFALKMGKPVVGLGTWELAKGGTGVDALARASDPADAVRQAIGLVAAGEMNDA
jgi:uncharacterized protein (TIGR00725 family)